jgi:hypothetical protein
MTSWILDLVSEFDRNLKETCTMPATTTIRAPRGTKNLSLAFFAAADAIKEDKRPAAIKAALASIRGELKASRERAKLAKSRAGKRGPGRPRKGKTV